MANRRGKRGCREHPPAQCGLFDHGTGHRAADASSIGRLTTVFALANPDPEIDPREAREFATVVATGRSDQPNQINNVLAFPGVFRGMLDAQAREYTEEMGLAAARAIADVVGEQRINPTVLVPSVFDSRVAPAVAKAVREVAKHATATGAAEAVDVVIN